jgi:AraC-like DNA-binding protein
LETLVRGVAAGGFLGLAIVVARGRFSPARLTGVLFCLAAAAHTLTQLPSARSALGWAFLPVWMLSVAGAGLFWAFALELFEDRARLVPSRLAPAGLLLTLGVGATLSPPETARWVWLMHNLLAASLVAHALLVVAGGWRGDLVETRRRLRGPILIASALYALAVITIESGALFLGSAAALAPLAAAALMLLSFLGLAAFGKADERLFGPALAPAAREAEGPAWLLRGDDALAANALVKLMREDRLYREEGLTIAALALKLKLPEHRLRRLINQRLGHRNFNAFLNRWRLADAKVALSDPVQASVSISTIALDAGFGSLGPFNRAFRAEAGQTPSEFRARALSGNRSRVEPEAQAQRPDRQESLRN